MMTMIIVVKMALAAWGFANYDHYAGTFKVAAAHHDYSAKLLSVFIVIKSLVIVPSAF